VKAAVEWNVAMNFIGAGKKTGLSGDFAPYPAAF
jgi:hypothetical protein